MARSVLVVAAAVLLALANCGLAQAVEVEVISGVVIRLAPNEWRIANIDAPQIEHTCASEAKLGALAQAKLAEIIGQGELEIRPTGERDLRHRKMAIVRINGADVGEQMIAAGLAQRHGRARPLCYASNFQRNQPRGSGLGEHVFRDSTMNSPSSPWPPAGA